jgi:uncharacterized protein
MSSAPLLERRRWFENITQSLKRHPVVVLLGPRQSGKTTLARLVAGRGKAHWFDLESAKDLRSLQQPELALSDLEGLVVIDEAQRQPEVFAALRPLVDRPGSKTRFLLLGSASPLLVQGVSESLAGRAHFIELSGFGLEEVGAKNLWKLWLRGGFPRSYLARSQEESQEWREDFVRSFFERDVPLLGIRVPPERLRQFWLMLANAHGRLWNASELARALGVTQPVVQRYLELLTGTFMVRQLKPWHENLNKRQVKSPKVYLRDSGLLHALWNVDSKQALLGRVELGASWEGFACESLLAVARGADAWFWSTTAGAELDLLLMQRGKRLGYEFKATEAPAMTKSLHIALEDLKLDRARIVYPGTRRYRVHPKVEVVPLGDALAELA